MGVTRVFRASRHFRREILDKLALGSDTMLDLGNLYTAALPAWMAAGFEQALDEDSLQAGEEVLTLGYGSGDAAEVIPFYMAEGWRVVALADVYDALTTERVYKRAYPHEEATAAIRFADAMEFAIDLDFEQYAALHDGRRVTGLDYVPQNEFVIDSVGTSDERHFCDLGIEYYRYVG